MKMVEKDDNIDPDKVYDLSKLDSSLTDVVSLIERIVSEPVNF